VDFALKSYLKYEYQAALKGLKTIEKEAFFKAINRSTLSYLCSLNPFFFINKEVIIYFI
jgi:hypothetical protein